MSKINWFFSSREDRIKWLFERFEKEINNSTSILDVGCYEGYMKNYIPDNIKYTGIDIAGSPDIFINLDKIEKLPFEDNQFDLIICTDVLEHLESIHLIFDELCRVSAKYVIITLPNAFAIIPFLLKGKKYTSDKNKRKQFGQYIKFYGLPFEKPDDRHRWFFSFSEANDFIKYRGGKNKFKIKSVESEWKYLKLSFKKVFLFFFRILNKNFSEKHFICLLQKEN